MAFAVMSRPKRTAAISSTPLSKRKVAPRRRAVDSPRSGFEKPASPLHPASLPKAPVIQAKLKIGEPNDKFEQEADRVAEEVMRMAVPDSELSLSQLNIVPLVQRRTAGNGRGPTGVMAPILQHQEALAGQQLSNGAQQLAGEETQEKSPCPSWFSDPESISKRAAETYVQNDMTPPSQATVARIDCEPPVPNGNYACTVHFSDGLIIRVIVRKQDIVVGVPPLSMTPPPETPLCFYDYACPEGNLILTKRECRSAKGTAPSVPTTIVQRTTAHGATGSSAPTKIQRKCAACTSSEGLCPTCIEEERIRRQPLASIINPMMQRHSKASEAFEKEAQEMPQAKETRGQAPVVTSGLEGRLNEIKNSGQPLPVSVRAFFEPRFEVDFSSVRVHTDGRAAQLAQAVNARAFTLGRDVVFGAGQYALETGAGKRLLAHELTHVVQQRRCAMPKPSIQRMKKGTDKVKKETSDGIKILEPPPPEHVRRVDAAIERIRRVAEDPDTYSACHDLFRKHCGSCEEGLSTLVAVFESAVLRYDRSGLGLGEGAWAIPCDPDIAYTLGAYNLGTEKLAASVMHEMGHVCGIAGEARHHLAERIRLGCIRGAPTLISVRGWSDPAAVVFGFRTTFKNWLGGQYALRGGLDLDLAGVLGADYPAQLGSVLLRFEARAPLWWGGERWGGSSLFTELGAGVGRFQVREPTVADPELTLHGGVIVGLGARFEWYLPPGIAGRRYPLALTAAYQKMIPLTNEAKKLQSVLIGIETWFGE